MSIVYIMNKFLFHVVLQSFTPPHLDDQLHRSKHLNVVHENSQLHVYMYIL